MASKDRGTILTVFAILFGVMAISNFLKPFQLFGDQTAFVFLGERSTGVANMVLGPLFGIFLAAYAYGIWNMKRFAMMMGHAYATYVILNLVLWSLRDHPGVETNVAFGVLYATVAIGVSAGSAIILTQRKADLA